MIHNKHKQCMANAVTKRKQKYKGHSCGGAILNGVFFFKIGTIDNLTLCKHLKGLVLPISVPDRGNSQCKSS